MGHDRNRCAVQVTAAVVRGSTELRVRINDEMGCACVELDGAPYPVLLGVTPTGAENLRSTIAAGLLDMAARRQAGTAAADG